MRPEPDARRCDSAGMIVSRSMGWICFTFLVAVFAFSFAINFG